MRDFTGVDGASGGLAVANTRWTPELGNAIVQEIANVIRDPEGGNAALAPGDNTQLLTAIQDMIAGALATTASRKKGQYNGLLGGGALAYVEFPQPFPDGTTYVVTLDAWNLTHSGARDVWVQRGLSSEAGFYVVVQTSNTGGNNTIDGFDWTAEAL